MSRHISETVQDKNYRMTLFPVTLGNLNYPKPPYFRHKPALYENV